MNGAGTSLRGLSDLSTRANRMRTHARSSNPLARGYLIRPYPDFLLRHLCAQVRSAHTPTVPYPLTTTVQREPMHAPYPDEQLPARIHRSTLQTCLSEGHTRPPGPNAGSAPAWNQPHRRETAR